MEKSIKEHIDSRIQSNIKDTVVYMRMMHAVCDMDGDLDKAAEALGTDPELFGAAFRDMAYSLNGGPMIDYAGEYPIVHLAHIMWYRLNGMAMALSQWKSIIDTYFEVEDSPESEA